MTVSESAARTAAALVVGVIMMLVAAGSLLALDQIVALNTVDVKSANIGSSIYGIAALESGSKLELRYRREHNISEEDGEAKISYHIDSDIIGGVYKKSAEGEISAPVAFTVEEGRNNVFCLEKSSTVTLSPGECSGT